jgi:hypothetical protein
MCPHTTIYVHILLYVSSHYYICPHTTKYVSASYHLCVRAFRSTAVVVAGVYVCPHTTMYNVCPHTIVYMCVLILYYYVYVCPHTTVYMCPHPTTYVSAHSGRQLLWWPVYMCVLILLYMSSYYYICVRAFRLTAVVVASVYVCPHCVDTLCTCVSSYYCVLLLISVC